MLNIDEAATAAQLVGFTTILGLVTWLVRRVFTHTIPRLAADYKDGMSRQQDMFLNALAKQQDQFKTTLDQQRHDFLDSLKHEREEFKAALHAEREYIGKRLEKLSDAVERLVHKG